MGRAFSIDDFRQEENLTLNPSVLRNFNTYLQFMPISATFDVETGWRIDIKVGATAVNCFVFLQPPNTTLEECSSSFIAKFTPQRISLDGKHKMEENEDRCIRYLSKDTPNNTIIAIGCSHLIQGRQHAVKKDSAQPPSNVLSLLTRASYAT